MSGMKSQVSEGHPESGAHDAGYQPSLKITRRPLAGWLYVILFTAPNAGVVVNVITTGEDAPPTDFTPSLGVYRHDFNEEEFIPFKGTICLTN